MADDSLTKRVAQLELLVEDLSARQEITDVLYRASRAVDRADVELLRTCFHPGARDYRGAANGPSENVCKVLTQWAPTATQHVTTNILIERDGDTARVESYVTAFHFIAEANDGSGQDELLRARYMDRFEKRGGNWKIAERVTVWDWSGISASGRSWFEAVDFPGLPPKRFIFGRRDRNDVSYTRLVPDDLLKI